MSKCSVLSVHGLCTHNGQKIECGILDTSSVVAILVSTNIVKMGGKEAAGAEVVALNTAIYTHNIT